MTDPPKSASLGEGTNLNSIHLGFLLVLIVAAAGMLNHELGPIREDIAEVKVVVNKLQENPIPKFFMDYVDQIERRLERLEQERK